MLAAKSEVFKWETCPFGFALFLYVQLDVGKVWFGSETPKWDSMERGDQPLVSIGLVNWVLWYIRSSWWYEWGFFFNDVFRGGEKGSQEKMWNFLIQNINIKKDWFYKV